MQMGMMKSKNQLKRQINKMMNNRNKMTKITILNVIESLNRKSLNYLKWY